MIKPKLWNNKDLRGDWLFTLKVDGVRGLRMEDGSVVSRAGKPLYNLDAVIYKDFEVFTGSWEDSVSRVKTHIGEPLQDAFIYSLDPLDCRLELYTRTNPTAAQIKAALSAAVHNGYEGLVLRQGDAWLKVKPKETYDVIITDIIEGKGKHAGVLGAVMTPMGKVGTGFTDAQRKELFNEDILGTVIEVDCMGLTPGGKFRHPRFIRHRFDK